MRLRILFFGVLRDRFTTEQILQVAAGTTAADILQHYRAAAPELTGLFGSIAVAINQSYAAAAHVLQDGDEVALLPPVSGGLC